MPLFLPFIGGVAIVQLYTLFPLFLSILTSTIAVWAVFRRRLPVVLMLVLGIAYAFLRLPPGPAAEVPELRITGSFLQPLPALTGDVGRLTFVAERAREAVSGKEREDLAGVEIDITVQYAPRFGRQYEIIFRPKDRLRLNPGWQGRNGLYGAALAMRETGPADTDFSGRVRSERAALNERIRYSLSPGAAGLVAAVTTGDTMLLSDEIKASFGAAGLTHILSISGTHFGLFSALLFGLFRLVILRLPLRPLRRLTVYVTPPQAAAALCLPFMLVYLGISGGGTPAVRSFIMIGLFLVGLLLGRKGAWLNSLLLAATILVIWDPSVLQGLSFQLSFLAVLFIGFATERSEEEPAGKGRIRAFMTSSLLITLAATLGTAPLVAGSFHYLSLISPLANLVAAPLIGFILVPLSVLAAFVCIFTGYYPLAPVIDHIASLSISAVQLFAKVPYADLRIPAFPVLLTVLFYLGFLPYLVFGRRKVLLLLPAVPFVVYALFSAAGKRLPSATFLDVGQGDAAVVELDRGRTMVVDTGRTGREVMSFLRYRGIRKIDVLVISHVHPDHGGGLTKLLRAFPIAEIWDNGLIEYPEGMLAGIRRRPLQRGDVIDLGDATATALHPYPGFYLQKGNQYTEENSASLVLKIENGGRSILFAGDLEDEAEEDLAHLQPWIRSDVLKVPHHGSRRSADPAFLSAVSPAVAVVSAGRGNHFGHPSPEALRLLEGSRIFRTDSDGAVKVWAATGGIGVKTYRESAFEAAGSWQQEKANIRRLFGTW